MGRLVKIGNGASASTRRNSTSDNASGPVVASGKKGRLVRISETPKYQLGELNPKDFQDSKRESRTEPQSGTSSSANSGKQPRANSYVQGSGMSKLQQMEAQREERQQKTQNQGRAAQAAQIVQQAEDRSRRARSVQKVENETLSDRGTNVRARNSYTLGEQRNEPSRIGKAAQSIALSNIGNIEMLGEGLKQANENADIFAEDEAYSGLVAQNEQNLLRLNGAVQRYGMNSPEAEAVRQEMSRVREQIEARRGEIERGIDPNSHAYRTAQMGQDKAAEALEGMSGVGGFLAETALSIADNASIMPLAAVSPALPLVVMSLKSAGSRAKELSDQGAGASEALTRGAVAGIIEGLSEKVSLGNFLEMVKTGGRGWLANLLKQAGIEGAEEITSYIANYAADKAAQDENASFDASEMLRQGASGALSGLFFGGVGTLGNALRGYNGVDYAEMDAIQGDGSPSPVERGVQNVRGTLGTEGQQTFDRMRTEGQDPTAAVEYTERFVDAYNKGRRNEALAETSQQTEARAVQQIDAEADTEIRAAWNAGRMDAITQEAERNRANQETAKRGAGLVRSEYTEQTLDSKTADALDKAARQLGVTVRFAEEGTVGGGQANAEIVGNQITIEKWNRNPVRALFGHEITHRIQDLSPDSYAEYKAAVRDAMGAEAYDAAMHEIETISRSAGVELNEAQIADEVVADYAGQLLENEGVLEEFIRKTEHKPTVLRRIAEVFRSLVQKLTGKQKTQAERALDKLEKAYREAAEAAESGERSERRQSIRKDFFQKLDAWDGKTTGITFEVGETSDALKSIGVKDRVIHWTSDSMLHALKHDGMSVPILHQVPDILEHPIVVMQSRSVGDRITIFGEARDSHQIPVLAVVEINPKKKNGAIEDFNVINNSYGKDHGLQGFMENSIYLYIDPNEKRTNTWLQGLRLQLPSDPTMYGSIGNIAYEDGDVKVTGKTWGEIFSGKGEPRYSLKKYTDAEEKQHAKDAAAYFGTTYKWSETGYITAAGRRLDFSGRHEGGSGGYRTVDHRDIRDALGDDYGGEDYSGSMVQFMSEGNIRISPESGGINLSVKPTKAQLDTLSDFISKQRGEVILDIDTVDGNTVSSTEYPRGTHANKVLNDIKAYFEDGSTPRVSELAQFRYSLKRPAELENAYAEIQTRVDSGEITAEEAIREKTAAVDRIYADYVRQYGAMEAGEKPARKVAVPKSTMEGTKVSQTIRTVMEAKATPDSVLPNLREATARGDFNFETYTDEAARTDAVKKIENVGWDRAQRDWFKAMQSGTVSKETTTMGWTLYNNAVNSGNTELAIDILNQMVKSQRNAAQALQATRILKTLSPDGQLYQVQRSVEDLQREINQRYRKGDAPKLVVDKELAAKLLKAETQKERDKITADIYRDIGRQMPSRFIDKLNAWRYLAMLGNPRTHVRNIVGNAGFMPVVFAKNAVGTGIEAAVSKVAPNMGRTKGVPTGTLLKAAWSDYANIKDAAMGGGKYSDFAAANQYVEEGRQIFGTSRWKLWNKTGGRALETLRKKNGEALDAEDVWFSQPHYANALAQYCAANKITAEQIRTGDKKVLRKARAYAINEAAKATYRDANALSEAVSSIGGRWKQSKNPVKKVTGVLVEGILPFRKTPANILARGLEYSPAGLLTGLSYDLVQVKKGNMTAAQAIDDISAGLTGTGLMMLGGWMVAQGVLKGGSSGDDEKDKLDDLAGRQDYALEIGGTSITLDWLAPEALPFFVGANLYQTRVANGGDASLTDYLDAVKNISEPMVEMSCLQSLNDVFDSVSTARYNGKSALMSVLASAATSYITQYVPTILGQAERSTEPERMSTYTTKGNKWLTTDMQYLLGKTSAKLPIWDFQQIPYIDAWGRTESNGSTAARIANNFLNPAYTSTVKQSDTEKEIERLYTATEEGSVVPDRAAKSILLKDGTKYLSAKEYVTYATEKGQKSYAMAEKLINSAGYKAASDEERVDMIRYAYQYANAVAKTKVSSYQLRGWEAKCAEVNRKTGLDETVFIQLYLSQVRIESYKDGDGDAISNSAGLQKMALIYNTAGLTEAQREALFDAFGIGKKIIHYNKAKVQQELEKARSKAK